MSARTKQQPKGAFKSSVTERRAAGWKNILFKCDVEVAHYDAYLGSCRKITRSKKNPHVGRSAGEALEVRQTSVAAKSSFNLSKKAWIQGELETADADKQQICAYQVLDTEKEMREIEKEKEQFGNWVVAKELVNLNLGDDDESDEEEEEEEEEVTTEEEDATALTIINADI